MLTRFAPAPTGHLHFGHVVNALYVWGAAHDRDGRVLLRIEDHDRQRSRPEYEASIIEDLAWLGFVHDGPIVRQSERDAIYRKALQPLIDRELVYGCTCTRAKIGAANGDRGAGLGDRGSGRGVRSARIGDRGSGRGVRGAGIEDRGSGNAELGSAGGELRYPNTCRDKDIPLEDGVGWRVRMEPGTERFFDELLGPQEQDPSQQCGDLLVRDRLNNWTYQFVATVDDYLQNITDVIRGEDLLASTGRQMRLARMLGRTTPPRFWHHPLVMKSPAQKLSKSDGDTGIRELRAAGWTRDAVLEKARALIRGRRG